MRLSGTVLDDIIAGVLEDTEARRREVSSDDLRGMMKQIPRALDARDALAGDGKTLSLIAEVKRASPSKGDLSEIPDPAALASLYEQGGATAISVLTEERRFRGCLADLDAVRSRVAVPVLRKDFIVDPYQVLEARAHGADLVLLIVAALDDALLRDLYDLIHELGMHALVETHTEEEIERALALNASIIGVNARDLRTLQVDAQRACSLLPLIPENRIAVAESAVTNVADVERYAEAGADAVLVGEALVTGADPAQQARLFRQVTRCPSRRTADPQAEGGPLA